jgi:hypothetical protein
VDLTSGDGNSSEAALSEPAGNLDLAGSETSDVIDAPSAETATSDGDNGNSSFWSGNPMELSPESLPIYKEMQGAFTQKTQDLASQRRQFESERETLREQQAQLQQAYLALQAKNAGPTPNDGAVDGSRETGVSVEELRKRFTEKAKAGDGFAALLEVMDTRLKQQAAAGATSDELRTLKAQMASLVDTVRPQQEASRLNSIFEDLKRDRYREFKDERVQQGIRKVLDSGDPTIMSLLAQGTEDGYRAALSLAGERAIRSINEGRLIESAKRRADTGVPSNSAGTSSEPLGSTANMSMDDLLDKVLGQDSDLGKRLG